MKILGIIGCILLFSLASFSQAECPPDMVCLTRQAAVKALADADKVIALEKESQAKDDAIAGIRKELNDMRIEFARVSGENTALKQNAVRMNAILDIALKNTKKRCLPFTVCLF